MFITQEPRSTGFAATTNHPFGFCANTNTNTNTNANTNTSTASNNSGFAFGVERPATAGGFTFGSSSGFDSSSNTGSSSSGFGAISQPPSSSFGMNMMAKMGWQEGQGLGKKSDGIQQHNNSHTIPPEWFVSDVPSHFLCCVCHEVPLEPLEHQRQNCSVLLCKGCHQTIFHRSRGGGCFGAPPDPSCPQCRQGTVSEFTAMNRVLRVHYFEPLQLRCHDPTCQQVITIGSYVKHRDMDCVGLEVVCPVEGCGTKCSRGRMAEHIYEEGLDHVQEMMKTHYCLLIKSNGNSKKSDKASVPVHNNAYAAF